MKTFYMGLWVKSYSLTMEKLELRTKQTKLLLLSLILKEKHSFVFLDFFLITYFKNIIHLSCFLEENILSEILRY